MTKLNELMGKSQLYSDFLAGQFSDLIDQTLATSGGAGSADDQRPAKRAKGRKGSAAPVETSATKRLLPLMAVEMRDYQLKGVAWLISLYKNGINGILADEMGLGKTIQTIGFISYLFKNTKASAGKYLVVGPLSTLSNWVAEFERFCPAIPVILYHGTPQEREELRKTHMKLGGSEQMPVIVTSYEIVIADRRQLDKHQWKLVVVDEGHRLKNYDCKLIRELRCLRADNRLLLTGTPLQNNLRELFSLLSFCMPTIFSDAQQFLDWFDIATPAAAIPSVVSAPLARAPSTASASAAAAAAAAAGPSGDQHQGVATRARRGRPPKAPAAPAAAAAEPQPSAAEQQPEPERPVRQTSEAAGTSGAPAPSEPAAEAGTGAVEGGAAQMDVEARARSGELATTSGSGSKADGAAPSGPDATVAACMVSRLHGILKPFVLRRVKADVNIGVPPKQEMVLYAEMTEEQKRLTRGLIDGSLQEELARESGRAKALNNLLMQMRKICNHPDLVTGPASGSSMLPSADELVAQCGKMALLERLLTELRKRGHRVLIFSQMTEMLNLIEAYLDDRGVQAKRIDGSVKWQQRKEDIAEFQAGKSDVFLLSTRAGGLGINLTAADTVIIYDSDWNPHQDSQAMDRCHRIGQRHPVLVFRLVTANSVENRMLAKADSKKALERIIMKKGAFRELQQSTSSTSAAELAALLNPDRRSGDVAQSGAVSDETLQRLLDRSHLAQAHERQQQQAGGAEAPPSAEAAGPKAGGKKGGAAGKGKKGEPKQGPAGAGAEAGKQQAEGPPMPPYPLVGVGYEVVMDEPRGQGLMGRIAGGEEEAQAVVEAECGAAEE
ncbi:hypothetical protein HYH03_002432 [Edaphochlamys debaryana]|uniref:Uncharacterized protein n=1 Tax=Edaphochlamys debaryana TaxID=47281 RepID=A0A835YAQ5_9CHLO|nr:hypothetical protein HYH03_002432 [Edaphochlamys debaryana]|eukprot:KAG2499485.1 hypothetical protein HYH03_002432 [Edaphochlamys debaryana]